MKKILSLILCAAMLASLAIVYVGAEGTDLALRFDDSCAYNDANDFGGKSGYFYYTEITTLTDDYDGFGLSFDFILGNTANCSHPKEPDLIHSAKINFSTGEDGTGIPGGGSPHKYFGYNATGDFFYIAYSGMGPNSGESANGYDYIAKSETGLIKPGVKYHIDFVFGDDREQIDYYLDGENILSFNLYDDLDYPQVMPVRSLYGFFTHINCTLDNLTVYTPDTTFDPTTGENADDYHCKATFDEQTVNSGETVNEAGWTFPGGMGGYADTFKVVDPATDVYCRPYDAEEAENTIFFERHDTKDTSVQSGATFTADITAKFGGSVDSLYLDLLQDEYITVKSVEGKNGFSASTLDGTDLTLKAASAFTGEGVIATVTYQLGDVASAKTNSGTNQNNSYVYGAKCETCAVSMGKALCYNYTVGDLNNDGKFNVSDATMILKCNAKWDLSAINRFAKEAGDVDGNGRTNNSDVTYYLKWLAKWPSTATTTYCIGGITT